MNMGMIKCLQGWYYEQIQGDNRFRIKINTLSNPGWSLRVILKDTYLFDKVVREVKYDISELDWLQIYKKEDTYNGVGGPLKLSEIVHSFCDWVGGNPIENIIMKPNEHLDEYDGMLRFADKNDVDYWLQAWYYSYCNGDWECGWGVRIETKENIGWHVIIDIKNTELEESTFDVISVRRTETDWFECRREKDEIIGDGGPLNLVDILEAFRKWSISIEGDIDQWRYPDDEPNI